MKLICKEECVENKNLQKSNGWTLLTGAVVLFMPKCALCWAAYMSLLSSFGIVIHYRSWFLPVAIMLFLLMLVKLLVKSIHQQDFFAFGLVAASGILIMLDRRNGGSNVIKITALVLMTIAVLMDNIIKLYKTRGWR